ncbi:MAG: PAS domain S-box protein [Myxococcales bacterium]|nr:MAG: PAS domain S-box protein [Myxococcales bacterium]
MPTETRFQEIKRYVRLDERDADLLRAFGAVAEPELPRIAREFYDRIREHEDAHSVFTGEEQIQRLQRSLVGWLKRVCGGVYDEAYHAQTAIIGRVHVRIGLPQRYMLTAMALIRVELLRIADRLPSDAPATREALVRILDLELAVMLEAYKDSYVERIEQAARQETRDLGDALAQAEQRYVAAVELAGVIIVGLDREGHIALFNHEAEQVTGYARDEVLGKAFSDVLSVDDGRGTAAERLEQVLAGERTRLVLEACLRTRSGKLRDVIWTWNAAGTVGLGGVVLLATGRDVTDEKARDERSRQNERLAAIGTLAAGLAHEIRNPLNGAQLHVSFLERAIKRNQTEQEMLEATRVVSDEIKRLANLVTEFLDFARPRPPELRPTSLVKAMEHACALVEPAALSAHVEVTCDVPSSDVEFQADSSKLTQVLLNLLKNAVEAGGSAVRLRGRRGPRHVFIDVEDDGPGLPTADAPIFDAFYSTKEGGTGLGLAITHRIVTDHRGTIDVSSRPGKTNFHIALPLEQGAGAAG